MPNICSGFILLYRPCVAFSVLRRKMHIVTVTAGRLPGTADVSELT